ncbi:MAG: 30S ribosome-binding factor RbfA [Lentisphaeria bacterium]|nr:30S ribosome-binding factor RbfA [Lentisphaeria bacterium]
MPVKPDRLARVNEILKREIADVLEKNGVNDSGLIVSITKVVLSSNLRSAAVYVSILGGKDPEANFRKFLPNLLKLRGLLQSNIARHVTLKYTPVIHFVHDLNIVEGDHVLALLQQMEKDESEREEKSAPGQGEKAE